VKVRLWGTRGSIPTPSTSDFVTSRFGGDTTCVSITSGDHLIILDGGSGLRLLGLHLNAKDRPVHASFFFSHVHWDHIQGFPFFLPGFRKDNFFNLYGPRLTASPGFVGSILEKALRGQQEDLNFPVQLRDMPASMNFQDLHEDEVIQLTGGPTEIKVLSRRLNHPGGCFGYRIEEHRNGEPVAVFAFCTDHEHGETSHPGIQALARDADLFLYDAQYTPEQYSGTGSAPDHIGWGHSTWEWGLKEAITAGARHLILHHHDPLHDDAAILEIESAAQASAADSGITVQAAAQNSVFELGA